MEVKNKLGKSHCPKRRSSGTSAAVPSTSAGRVVRRSRPEMPVLSREPEVGDRLPVKEGASGQIVEHFANSRNVQGFPGFVSMEVLSSEVGDEVLVITRWQDKVRQGRLRLAGSQ